MANPFADLIPGGQRSGGGVIPGTPQPRLPSPQTSEQARSDELSNQLKELQIANATREGQEAEAKAQAERDRAAKEAQNLELARNEITNVISAARRAKSRSNDWFMTGIGSSLIGSNTPAGVSLQGDLDVIGANTAFSRLQQMRESSPTGGALGSITERELALLQSTVASLNPGQSDADFQRNMDTIIERYEGILGRLPGATPVQTGSQEAAIDTAGREDITEDQSIALWGEPLYNADGSPLGPGGGPSYDKAGNYLGLAGSGEGAIAPDISDARNDQSGFLAGADAFVRGAADTLTLGLADKGQAVLDTVFNGGTYAQNVARQRGINDYDSENYPVASIAGAITGGLALPTFGASGARQLAMLGGGYGGAYNFNTTDGSLGERLVSAGSGAAIGAAGGLALGGIQSRLARGGGDNAPRANAAALMEAANRQGVDVLPADVGGPITRRFTSGVLQSPFGSGPVVRAANRAEDQAANRLSEIAAAEGAPMRQEALGDTARAAAERYISDSGRAGRGLYENARNLASGAELRGQAAVQALDNNIAELSDNAATNAPLIQGLERLRADLADEGGARLKNVDAIRNLRSSIRAEAQTEGLRGTDYQRRANDVLSALSDDIASQLPPEAAAAFREADRAWAQRLDTIDNVMNQVLGPRNDRSAEQVANRLGQMARGDSARLGRFIDNLNPDEAGVVRGSLIQELGRATSGQQNAAGNGFSFSTFLSNWDRMPERTRAVLFRGDTRAALDDLAKVAEGVRDRGRSANSSNTTGAGAVLSALGNLSTVGGLAVVENLTGRLLASPRFARWLARPPQDRGRAIRRLSQIAAREPALASDINVLKTVIEGGSRAAASEDTQNTR